MISTQHIKLFLRLALSLSFLSAVADRFGLWPAQISVWGNWENFVAYTQVINPWLPEAMVSPAAIVATAAEVIFPVCLLVGFKTELVAKLSGILLLIFALAMAFSTGIKGAFDYSVFTASAAAFALSTMKEKFLEVDRLIVK
ncbi:MAG: DoxX family membrane protein [Cyclobacteriaceae bacterium]|nr:DoxX family membrane protein [Cyclobacteriaceae bacterium]